MGVCHAELQYSVIGNKCDQIITSYPVKRDLEIRFFNFMADILYQSWGQYFHLEYRTDGQPYIRISDLDKIPAKIVMNFCICSRIPMEFSRYLTSWGELVDQGLHPSFALATCRLGTTNLDRVIYNTGRQDADHWPLWPGVSLKRLLITGPDFRNYSAASFKSKPSLCCPTNTIWGETTNDLRELQGSTLRVFWEKWKERLA